jgi:hypothetical protein
MEFAAVHMSPVGTAPTSRHVCADVGFRWNSGNLMLAPSFSGYDPKPTSASSRLRG